MEVLASAIRWENELNIQIEKEAMKLSLFTYDTIVYIGNPKESTKNLGLINGFSKCAGYKINPQLYFHMLVMNNPKIKSRKQFPS